MHRTSVDVNRKIIAGILLFAAIFVAYLNSFHVPFLFDDTESVFGNGTLSDFLSFRWLAPPADGTLAGRPVANGTFALNMALGGTGDFGFHVFNFLIHVAATVVLFILLESIFSSLRTEALREKSFELAWICALIWGVHPLNTAAVTYISQRTEELMGLFYILVIYSYWRFQENPENRSWALAAIASCFLGVGCKEEIATAPILVLLVDRTFHSGSFKEALSRRKFLYTGLFASWLVVAFLWLSSTERRSGISAGVRSYQYALAESRVIIQYLKLTVFPSPLVFDYALTPYRRYAEEIPFAVSIIVIGAVVAFLVYKRKSVGLLLAWFFLILAPSSSFIPIAIQPMGENRVYLSSIGIIILVVCSLYLALRKWSWAVFAIIGCTLIYLTINRNEDYRNADRIWTDTILSLIHI